MNHKAFINELDSYGLVIRYGSFAGDAYSHKLMLNGHPISNGSYEFFGYYCGGAYAQCNRTNKEEFTTLDFAKALTEGIKILNERSETHRKAIDFHTLRSYINQRPYTKKVEREAANRIFQLVLAEWQQICRFREALIIEENKRIKTT